MSEEEKKAIEYAIECLRGFNEALEDADEREDPFIKGKYKSLQVGIHNEDYEMFTKMINLFKGLKKEIEELKNNELDYTTIYMNGVYVGKKKVKDKIREKINKLKKNDIEYSETIAILEELLEDN